MELGLDQFIMLDFGIGKEVVFLFLYLTEPGSDGQPGFCMISIPEKLLYDSKPGKDFPS